MSVVRISIICLLSVGTVAPIGASEWPTFSDVGVRCQVVEIDEGLQYTYSVSNPQANTLGVGYVSLVLGEAFPCVSQSGPQGWRTVARNWWSDDFDHTLSTPAPDPDVSWITPYPPAETYLSPGSTVSGFTCVSGRPPQVGELVVDGHLTKFYNETQEYISGEVSVRLERDTHLFVSAPTPLDLPTLGAYAHWDRYLNDIERAADLGWIADAGLFDELCTLLGQARVAVGEQRFGEVSDLLGQVMDLATAVSPTRLTPEGYAIVYFNARYLRDAQPPPCEPALELTPSTGEHHVGEWHDVTARPFNRATGDAIYGEDVTFHVTEGPHEGLVETRSTGGEMGVARWRYRGVRLGEDMVVAQAADPCADNPFVWSEPVTVRWTGGVDLDVFGFSPPRLESAPGRTFYLYETTRSLGTLPAPPTITRYYIGSTPDFEPSQENAFAEREVPALAPGEESGVSHVAYAVPGGEGAPLDGDPADSSTGYYLVACVDADDRVAELDEDNNCSNAAPVPSMALVSSGAPPDCGQATAEPASLWPPNHEMQAIEISGISDPDDDPVTVEVLSVRQDEPVEGIGEGNTSPDAQLEPLMLRSERAGGQDGRVYHVTVRGTDGSGGSCTAEVTVCVPHDRRDECVDGGPLHDSTGE